MARPPLDRLAVDSVDLAFNPEGGLLDEVTFRHDGRTVSPLHRAPWLGSGDDIEPVHLRHLAGDFFCAPFGAADVEPAPPHGFAANGNWAERRRTARGDGSLTASYILDRPPLGSTLAKDITLRPGEPIIYQRHIFEGGSGAIPIAHHAMIHVPGGVRLSFSKKDFGATPDVPLEGDPARGNSILAYPARFESLSRLPLAKGGTVDARSYPFADGHEDLLELFDPKEATIGWTAALAKADGFLFFALKDARMLPQTVMWMSHGGRSYAPWSSRHRAVLGLEEGCTLFGNGHRASTAANDFTREGYRTSVTLDPDQPTVVRYAFGAIAADPSWSEVADIRLEGGTLVIADIGGGAVALPFDPTFFAES